MFVHRCLLWPQTLSKRLKLLYSRQINFKIVSPFMISHLLLLNNHPHNATYITLDCSPSINFKQFTDSLAPPPQNYLPSRSKTFSATDRQDKLLCRKKDRVSRQRRRQCRPSKKICLCRGSENEPRVFAWKKASGKGEKPDGVGGNIVLEGIVGSESATGFGREQNARSLRWIKEPDDRRPWIRSHKGRRVGLGIKRD